MRILGRVTLLVVVGTLCGDAAADVYRGPSGRVPPGLREPSDPTPPPPPPPVGPSASPPPTAPTVPTPPRATEPPPRPAGPILPTSFEDWMFGWHARQDAYVLPLGLRDAVDAGLREQAENVVREVAIRSYDGPPSVGAAGLVAFARAVGSPADLAVLVRALEPGPGRNQFVRERAALGLGLFRRGASPGIDAGMIAEASEALLTLVEDETEPARLRGFAAAARGLLEPTGDAESAAAAARLLGALRVPRGYADVEVGLLLGLSLFPRDALGAEGLASLRQVAYEGTAGDRRVDQVVRGWAIHALGRLGTAEDVEPLARILGSRRGVAANERRSVAIALGTLGRGLEGGERVRVARRLLRAWREDKDTSTRAFCLDSLRHLLVDGDDVRRETLAGEALLTEAAFGEHALRDWAALELGLLARTIEDATSAGDWLRHKARRVLDAGLREEDMPPRTRAAFALAAGLAAGGDTDVAGPLREQAADRRLDKSLRAYATLGLALIPGAAADPLTQDVIRTNLAEHQNEELTLFAAQAGGPEDLLVQELERAPSSVVKTAAALSLARAGTDEAIGTLLRAARSDVDATRACALKALALVLDPGTSPWQERLFGRFNHRTSTSLVSELLSIP